jgi:hypothetical protein
VGVVWAALLAGSGCHLIFPFGVAPPPGDTEAGAVVDLNATSEGIDLRFDLTPAPCVVAKDSDTLALYTFEDSTTPLRDSTGDHDGTIVGKLSVAAGKPGCGKALVVPYISSGPAQDYGEIPHHGAWDGVRAVDLWVRFEAKPGEDIAVLSRDANGTTKPGHFGIYRLCNGAIYVRLQHPSGIAYHCSAPVPDKQWIHVGVNVGAPAVQLFVDGVLATPRASVACPTETFKCTATGSGDIAGNTNPWIVGASSGKSVEGTGLPVHGQLHGAIDSLRISKARRSFK